MMSSWNGADGGFNNKDGEDDDVDDATRTVFVLSDNNGDGDDNDDARRRDRRVRFEKFIDASQNSADMTLQMRSS